MASFSFAFSGDDIEQQGEHGSGVAPPPAPSAATQPEGGGGGSSSSSSAFPIQGMPVLPPARHGLREMLARLPSKMAYGTLQVDLDGQGSVEIPRRELWDVRVQLMAEADGDEVDEPGLGSHDVKTGIYEGGFKSWESSVDLVKVVLGRDGLAGFDGDGPSRVIELGCGTALPSVALFRQAVAAASGRSRRGCRPLSMTLADYNPSVLYLVTLPNLVLAWALEQRDQSALLQQAFYADGELELSADVTDAFERFLGASQIELSFVSGGWSGELVDLLYAADAGPSTAEHEQQQQCAANTLVLGAETIYSPFALGAFAEAVLAILGRERQQRPDGRAAAVVAAKRLYFGVGGSLDDFADKMRASGAAVEGLREETEGVRRGVVRCVLGAGPPGNGP